MDKLVTDYLKTGVIVARFQVPELHKGHHQLIQTVKRYHKKVIIFLGTTKMLDYDNPLDYHTRERMVKKHYPDVITAPLPNCEYDNVWVETLDTKIKEIEPINKIVLYGSRDSFIRFYEPYGRFECMNVLPELDISGTELRKEVCNEVLDSEDFRRGLIYEKHNSYPKVYPTVDIIITRKSTEIEILLGQKHKEMNSGKWRIPGGFIEKRHNGGLNAAVAEVKEETNLDISVKDLKFITQVNIDDWRLRKSKDVIMTTLFSVHIGSNWEDKTTNTAKAGDDLGAVKWFKLNEALNYIHPVHKPLLEEFLKVAEF